MRKQRDLEEKSCPVADLKQICARHQLHPREETSWEICESMAVRLGRLGTI